MVLLNRANGAADLNGIADLHTRIATDIQDQRAAAHVRHQAMKLMNEFQAEFDLEIVQILGENGTMVEFGAPLFEVRRI